MKVAVWDTYVTKENGNVLHFDIIVPEEFKDRKEIFGFGKAFIKAKGKPDGVIDVEQCQFCHIEEPTQEMLQAIRKQGYYILEMDEIPAKLPENPSRRDLIFHLRAHYSRFRFADFRGKSLEEIQMILNNRIKEEG